MAIEIGSAVAHIDLDVNEFLSKLGKIQTQAQQTFKNVEKSFEGVTAKAKSIAGGMKTVSDKIVGIGGGISSVGDKIGEIGNKIADAGKKVSDFGGKFESIGKSATLGLTTPIVTAVTASVKEFANLEQSIGGVETLFKGSAQEVIKNAEVAYKTAGVDANSYMEQVTSFSATLLQGVGGDTEKAAQYADLAIKDMSDNANKMGTDIGAIQNAYQGFAKDNYTMLDNLKLGYGGSAGEMARLVNESGVLNGEFEATAENVKDIPFDVMIQAIHQVQENMDITGTTAKEANDTVIGSFNQAKGAVENFLQQLGNPDADMEKFSQQAIEAIGIFVDNVKRVLGTIWDNLPISPLQKKILLAVAAFGPVILIIGKIITIIGTAITVIGTVIKVIGVVVKGIGMVVKVVGLILNPIGLIITAIVAVVGVIIYLWNTNEDFRNAIISIWEAVKNAFKVAIDWIVDTFNTVVDFFKNLGGEIKNTFDVVIDWIVDTFNSIVTFFAELPGNIWNFLVNIVTSIGNWIADMAGKVVEFGANFIDGLLQFFKDLPRNLGELLGFAIGSVIKFGIDFTTKAIEIGTNFVTNLITFFAELPGKIWNFLVMVVTSVAEWYVNMVTKAIELGSEFVNNVITFFKELPGNIWNFITNAYDFVVTWAHDMVTKAIELGTEFLNNVSTFFKELPGNIWNFLVDAFNFVTEWVSDMLGKAREAGSKFLDNVVTFFKELPGNLWDFLVESITKLALWVTDMKDKATEAIEGFFANLWDGAKELGSNLLDIGEDIVKGIWNGINGATDWIKDKIGKFFGGFIDGIKDGLGISSPSKVFRDEIGRWLPLGIAEGVEQSTPKAMSEIEEEINKGLGGIEVEGLSVDVEETVNKSDGFFRKTFNSLIFYFGDVENKIIKSVKNMSDTIADLISETKMIALPNNELGYIGYNGSFEKYAKENRESKNTEEKPQQGNGDTFIFYSPKAIDEIEASRKLKETKRDIAEGF